MKMSLHENEPVGAWSTLSYESELRRETHSDREAKKKKKNLRNGLLLGYLLYTNLNVCPIFVSLQVKKILDELLTGRFDYL